MYLLWLYLPWAQITLEPGDVLFVPRGLYHHTATPEGGEASLHVTIGVAPNTDLTLALALALTLAQTPTLPTDH